MRGPFDVSLGCQTQTALKTVFCIVTAIVGGALLFHPPVSLPTQPANVPQTLLGTSAGDPAMPTSQLLSQSTAQSSLTRSTSDEEMGPDSLVLMKQHIADSSENEATSPKAKHRDHSEIDPQDPSPISAFVTEAPTRVPTLQASLASPEVQKCICERFVWCNLCTARAWSDMVAECGLSVQFLPSVQRDDCSSWIQCKAPPSAPLLGAPSMTTQLTAIASTLSKPKCDTYCCQKRACHNYGVRLGNVLGWWCNDFIKYNNAPCYAGPNKLLQRLMPRQNEASFLFESKGYPWLNVDNPMRPGFAMYSSLAKCRTRLHEAIETLGNPPKSESTFTVTIGIRTEDNIAPNCNNPRVGYPGQHLATSDFYVTTLQRILPVDGLARVHIFSRPIGELGIRWVRDIERAIVDVFPKIKVEVFLDRGVVEDFLDMVFADVFIGGCSTYHMWGAILNQGRSYIPTCRTQPANQSVYRHNHLNITVYAQTRGMFKNYEETFFHFCNQTISQLKSKVR